jgi:hypothetical protein
MAAGFPSIYCQVEAGFLTSYMAAVFPSIYCQVWYSWSGFLTSHMAAGFLPSIARYGVAGQAFSPATWQQAFLPSIARYGAAGQAFSLHGRRLLFQLLPGKEQLVAGCLTSYMATGFPSIFCQVRGSW